VRARLLVMREWQAARVTVLIVVVLASCIAALSLITDLPRFLDMAVWIAPVVVFIPYAYSPAAKRPYGLWTVVAALVVPAVAAAWVIWLVLTLGVIGRHP